jgi:hypothetical protein
MHLALGLEPTSLVAAGCRHYSRQDGGATNFPVNLWSTKNIQSAASNWQTKQYVGRFPG